MLGRPDQLTCPALTQAQARRINAIKRTHLIIGYEGVVDHDYTAVVVTTTREEFAIREDGTILGSDIPLPPSPARRRRRSLRNPAGTTEQESM